MDYVALLSFRDSVSAADRDAALMRRAGWQYPEGTKPIAEYWPLGSDVQVVTIFSTDSTAALFELELEWGDVFDMKIHPAVSADEGLKIGPEVVGNLMRLKQ
jgi:hypothetical protein